MPDGFNDVTVVRQGDAEGNRMIVKITTSGGLDIFAIAVPQDWPSRTGPTWTYLFENEGLTLIDAGATGSFSALEEGLKEAGYQVRDVDRVIITHGHQDHDGAAGQMAQAADAELWAHDIYSHLLPYDSWELQRSASSPIQREMHRVVQKNDDADSRAQEGRSSGYRHRQQRYMEIRREYKVGHGIRDGDTLGNLTFMSAPGHSPDEICIRLDGYVFTGDHVLPEITPHPTMKAHYKQEIRDKLPEEYRDEDRYYGLERYLRSLALVVDLGPEISTLPAHRFYNKNHFNFQTTRRAQDVIDHHVGRFGRILKRVSSRPTTLEDVTQGIFTRRKLIGGNLYAAMSEVVAHIEVLQDSEDLVLEADGILRGTGSENYCELINDMGR